MNEADNEAEVSSGEVPAAQTNFTAIAVPPPPTTHLVFDTQQTQPVEEPDLPPPPVPSPPPDSFENKEVVNLNFYTVLEEKERDPELTKVLDIYKKPPPVPKRADSIAKNIEKYFNTELLKEGVQEDMELIEERILNENSSDTDDQIEDLEQDESEINPEPPVPASPTLSVAQTQKSVPNNETTSQTGETCDDPFARAVARGKGQSPKAPPKPPRSAKSENSEKICRPRHSRPKPVRKQDPNKLKFAGFFAFCSSLDQDRRRDALDKVVKL